MRLCRLMKCIFWARGGDWVYDRVPFLFAGFVFVLRALRARDEEGFYTF